MPSLFIIRTPLQAWIAESVRQIERCDSFDVVYVTVDDAPEDRRSFERFSMLARTAWYVVARRKRPDLFHQIDLALQLERIRRSAGHSWKKVFLASFEAHGINALACRAGATEIIGFDDGTANINLTGKYASDSMSLRERIYRRALGGASNHAFVSNISRHYTIFGDIPHLVSSDRLIALEPLVHESVNRAVGIATYFIGQPLREVLDTDQINRLKATLKLVGIEFYVTHPREAAPLDLGPDVRVIEKGGEVAERAIEKHADGREIWLYGWFSTVMFTMRPVATRRIMYLPCDDPRSIEFARIARKAGCEVIEF